MRRITAFELQWLRSRFLHRRFPSARTGEIPKEPQARSRCRFRCTGPALKFVATVGLVLSPLPAAPETRAELTYVRKATREATRQATLAAAGMRAIPGKWKLIGPFDNADRKGLDTPFPPEQAIDTSKSYIGKNGKTVRWTDVDFPDGRVHDLDRFGPDNDSDAVVYLLREIVVDAPQEVAVSLGSDDGLKVILNGQQLLVADVLRPCAPDQERLMLKLLAGRNQLLLKVTQGNGQWQFYFAPALASENEVELRNRLDADFPPTPEGAHYRMVTFPIPNELRLEVGGLGYLKDGSLLIGTRRGEIWRLAQPLDESFARFELSLWAKGLHEITGMLVVGADVYVAQRPELTVVSDSDGDGRADRFRTYCAEWGISGDYHEYAFGPVRDAAGNFYLTLNLGFAGGHQSRVPYRGWCVKVDRHGRLEPVATGLRSPNGVGINPAGDVFYCDNQGEWVASCKMHHVKPGEFYGHPAGLRWRKDASAQAPEPVPPCIWFPYGRMSQSASQPVWDVTDGKFGPFAGQCFVGDQTQSLVMRVALEKVNGHYQGACFHFRRGFDCGVNRLEFAPDGSLFVGMTSRGWGSVGGRPDGLQRLVYTGKTPFEVHRVALKAEGFEVHFTQPVDASKAAAPAAYGLQSYRYNYWANYGSPEVDRRPVTIAAVHVAPDARSVLLEVPGLVAGRVYEIALDGVRSQFGKPLLHTEAFYTLNHLAAPARLGK